MKYSANSTQFTNILIVLIPLIVCMNSQASINTQMFPWDKELIFTNNENQKERKLTLSRK